MIGKTAMEGLSVPLMAVRCNAQGIRTPDSLLGMEQRTVHVSALDSVTREEKMVTIKIK